MKTLDHRRGALTRGAMTSLARFFAEKDHRPSADHWAALEDAAGVMARMADGMAAKVFLSAIDPGVGKSQAAIHFARALASSPAHGDVGMMLCVGRLAEVETIAQALLLPPGKLAVMTSDETLNAAGNAPPDHAQVLVTTQQRIERATQGQTFADASAFFYRGMPRRVRVWDEAWLPGAAVTLNGDDLLCLPKMVRSFSPQFADGLRDFAVDLARLADGDAVEVPDFQALYGVSLYEVLASASGTAGRLRDDQQMAATALVTLNGKTARVRRDGRTGSTVLTYRDTLPDDLLPLLVLDASARVRHTYTDMEAHRGNIVRLRSATKDYSPLCIHTWQTSGSKSGFERNGDELVKGIADTILTKPAESWLVVVHKPGGRLKDIEKAVRFRLSAQTSGNVHVITWGNHMATNAYSEVGNVVLAGTLFMRDSFYTALTHLAQSRDVAPGLVSQREVAETMRGEHRHIVLQAICRGRVRKSDGARCLPMDAYIIAAPRSGIPTDLGEVFPGCRVIPWNPTKPTLAGQPEAALEFVRAALARGDDWVPFRDIRAALKMDRPNFRRLVLDKPHWWEAVAGLGVEPAEGPRGSKGLRRVPMQLAA